MSSATSLLFVDARTDIRESLGDSDVASVFSICSHSISMGCFVRACSGCKPEELQSLLLVVGVICSFS